MATRKAAPKKRTVGVKVNGTTITLDYARHTPYAKLAHIAARLANAQYAPYLDGEFLKDFREAMHMYLDEKTYNAVFTPEVEDDIYQNINIYIDVYGALKAARDDESKAMGEKFAALFNPDMD